MGKLELKYTLCVYFDSSTHIVDTVNALHLFEILISLGLENEGKKSLQG